MHGAAVSFVCCNFLLTSLGLRREKQCWIFLTWECPSQMSRGPFVCPPQITVSFNQQWSVFLIICLQFQRLACVLSFRSLKKILAILANIKCHTLKPDTLKVKCFKTSKVIITKCLISKHTLFLCFHRMKCPSQSHATGSRPGFSSWAFWTLRFLGR